MKKSEAKRRREQIIKGVKAAVLQLYREAKKNKWELVISENGKIKKIRPV
jgi:hypothetical protein